jgi:ABC-2 type transport system permease protein
MAMLVANLFSGFIVPLAFFPHWLRVLAYATPFPAMVQMPIDVFVGKAHGGDVVTTLVVQAAWAAGLLVVCRGVFAAGVRKLVVQGG